MCQCTLTYFSSQLRIQNNNSHTNRYLHLFKKCKDEKCCKLLNKATVFFNMKFVSERICSISGSGGFQGADI